MAEKVVWKIHLPIWTKTQTHDWITPGSRMLVEVIWPHHSSWNDGVLSISVAIGHVAVQKNVAREYIGTSL
jgi:hypothetical protein